MSALTVTGPEVERGEEILTPEALAFVADLQQRFGVRRDELLAARRTRRDEVSRTGRLDFLAETADVRAAAWQVAPAPADLQDRRVEITGPTERKMAINALNSGARVWLADFEDANTPHWANVVGGQVNLYDAVRRTITLVTDEGREYQLRDPDHLPVILPRPRGWHLPEAHLTLDGNPVVGALVDFGLYFFHNARELLARGSGPYFYLPKMESHLEARLWDDVFSLTEELLGIPHGTIRATVLIETIPAAFEMEEMLYELRDHCAGLNAGRWDYIFSIIKNFRGRGAAFTLPDRARITMTVPFMRAYTELLVATCHKRGAHAIGGMSAFIPNRRDPEVTARALEQVAADKRREAGDGFDGTWVAHPDLIDTARAEFDAVLGERPNQVDRLRDDVHVEARQLVDLRIDGEVTDAGVAANVSIALRYLESWLRGVGAAAIDDLMEDAATAEISRSQLWQWIRQGVVTTEGTRVTGGLVERLLEEELAARRTPDGRFDDAAGLVRGLALEDEFPTFLTIEAYSRFLVEPEVNAALSAIATGPVATAGRAA
jgi:malate synthase